MVEPMRPIFWLPTFMLCFATKGLAIVDANSTTNNTSDPGGGLPWGNVGRIGSASGEYLGGGWVLTANHVGVGAISFDGGASYYQPDGWTTRLTNSFSGGDGLPTDIVLFHLSTIPSLPSLQLSTVSPTTALPVTMVGFGPIRGSAEKTYNGGAYTGFDWGPSGSRSYGTNVIQTSVGTQIDLGNGTLQVFGLSFTQPTTQPSREGQVVPGDSGGAVFYKNPAGTWLLEGMIDAYGPNLGTSATASVYGDFSYIGDIATYSSQILTKYTAPTGGAGWNGTNNANWATSANWSASPAPGTLKAATFNSGGNGQTTISLGSGVTISSVIFDTSNAAAYTIGSGAVSSQALTLNNGGTVTVTNSVTNTQLFNANLTLGTNWTAQTYTIDNYSTQPGTSLTLAGNIAGSSSSSVETAGAKTFAVVGTGNTAISGGIANGGATSLSLLKYGSGTLTLSGANSYSGGNSINGGSVVISGSGTLGAISGTLALGGGSLDLGGITSRTVGAVTISAAAASGDTLKNGSLSGTSYAVSNASGNVVVSANLLNSSAALTMSGAGTLTLSGTNTYLGGTTINSGTLVLGQATDTLANTGAVTVNGGTLAIGGNSDTVGALLLASGSITGTTGVLTGASFALQSGSVSAVLAGTFGLSKTTGGTVTLTGANTFSGGTTISSGILNVNGDAALGNAAGAVTISNGATLQAGGTLTTAARTITIGTGGGIIDTNGNSVNLNAGSVVTGTTLTKTGAGTLTLSGTNTYNGGTVINAGTLNPANDESLGAVPGTPTAASITINGGSTLILGTTNNMTLNANRGITLGSGTQNIVKVSRNGVTVAGVISGSGGVNFGDTTASGQDGGGGGRMHLTGANTYSGDTTITYAGILDPGLFLDNSLALQNTTLNYNNANATGADLIWFNGGNSSYTLGGLKGDKNLNLSSQGNTAHNLKIGNNNQDTTYTGILSSSNDSFAGITKIGTGILTLTGANTFAGLLTVESGILKVATINNADSSGPLGQGSAAVVLGKTGGVTGTLEYTGGTASSTRPFAMASGGTVVFQVDSVGAILTLSGAISGTGTLTKTGAGTLTLGGVQTYSTLKTNAGVTNLSGAFGGILNANATTNITVSEDLLALNIGTVALTPLESFAGSDSGPLVGVVPEPGSMGLLLTGALGLLARRRR